MTAQTNDVPIADTIFFNGKIATQDDKRSFVTALAVKNGRVLATGSAHDVMRHAGGSTPRIDLNGRTVIPGLNDSHLHVIRGGLNFNMELRWDGVPSLADALDCCAARCSARRRRSGCASSAAGTNCSSPSAACRRSTRSTRSRPIRRCSSCTCTTARC
jgi:predicted amidohydrolase YtcJ